MWWWCADFSVLVYLVGLKSELRFYMYLWALEGNFPIIFSEDLECFIALTSMFDFTLSFLFIFLVRRKSHSTFFI